jgi:predicted nucleotidyltransferase
VLDVAPYQDALAAFARRWRVKELALFGSALRDDFGPESDVDLLVTFEEGETWSRFDLAEMREELAEALGRPVDLIEKRAVEGSENWIRRRAILSTARTVYAG